MGTRSTVHFIESGKTILSVYQQYDGYPTGVGAQLAHVLGKHTSETEQVVMTDEEEAAGHQEKAGANGMPDLALLYVEAWKHGPYNMYVTSEMDTQEYNYYVYSHPNGFGVAKVKVYYEEQLLFSDTVDEFMTYILRKLNAGSSV